MSQEISQQAFDDVDDAVIQNLEQISLSTDEATKNTTQQVQSQSLILQNIIDNTLLPGEVDLLSKKIANLKKILHEKPVDKNFILILEDLKNECDSGIAKRIHSAQCGLYDELIHFLSSNKLIDETLKFAIFETLISLMTGYPDLLDPDGFNIIESSLKHDNDTLINLTLKWSIECCIKHELNRQKFLSSENILNALRRIMQEDSVSPDVLRISCKLFQTFVLNDDIRAEIPMAYKYACLMSNEFLIPLILRLRKFREDRKVAISILQALAAIIVRHEYCQRFVEAGGPELLRNILVNNPDDEIVCRSCYSLIKVVVGDDKVKAKIMELIPATILVSTAQKFINSVKTSGQTLAALHLLSLRNIHNCQLLCNNNVGDTIIQAMKIHISSKKILKNVCWLIKNLCPADKKFTRDLLSMGVEVLLREFLIKFPDCSFEINIALRALGCEVEIVEMVKEESQKLIDT